MTKPVPHQGDLAKLPRALAPLLDRKQWCIWRWTPNPDGSWQKPPFIATHPDRHANIKDVSTWSDYTTALAAVQTGQGDGISYVLTADDPFAAIDLDHCRDGLGGVDIWAQLFLERGRSTYSELTPSLKPASDLPPMYSHGDPDPRPLKSWLVKGLIPACVHGLLAGQWEPTKPSLCSTSRPR
jgi:hypothetical protein